MDEITEEVLTRHVEHLQSLRKQAESIGGNEAMKHVASSLLSLAEMNVKLGREIVKLKERVKKLESEPGMQ